MLEEIIETAVEIAADVAEAVITEKRKRKKMDPQPCDTETEQIAVNGN